MAIQNSNNENEFISEINVTPLVDVILVLLIIFMISAPLLMNDIALKLPKTKKVAGLSEQQNALSLSIDMTGAIFIDKKKLNLNTLETYLKKSRNSTEKPIYLKVDEQTNYVHVAKVLALLKSLNFQKISLVTEIERK